MTILDEKEPTISLKLIVLIVSLVTFGAIATLVAVSSGQQVTVGQSQAAAG